MHLDKRPRNAFKPELVALETRSVPSATVSVAGAKMTINTDPLGGLVQIRDDGRGNVTVNGGGVTQAAGIKQIVVEGGAGTDTIDFRTTGNLLHALDIHVNLGAGTDRAYFDLYRGISGVPLDIDIAAGTGPDSVDVMFGAITAATVNVHAAMGYGADTTTVTMFNGASGASRVNLDVAGETGADRVDLNVMGKIDAAAIVNQRVENVADANDRVLLRYRGELDGKLNVNIDKAAAQYGVQSRFALDAASVGTLRTVVSNGTAVFGSSLIVTDHTGDAKVSVLDRLENILTSPPGTKVTRFRP